MTTSEFNFVLKQAVLHFGYRAQALQTIEECGELIQVLCKDLNDRLQDRDALIDEMADVQLMLWQLEEFVDINAVKTRMNEKAERLAQRLNINLKKQKQ